MQDPYIYEPINVDTASEPLLRDTLWGILCGVPSRSYAALKAVHHSTKKHVKNQVAQMTLDDVRKAITRYNLHHEESAKIKAANAALTSAKN